MSDQRPASISDQARAILAAGDPTEKQMGGDQSIDDIRKATLETYRPACEAAIEEHRVTTKDISVAGIECLEVLPEQANDGRQLLYLFGGGFMLGSPFEELPITASIAAQTGARIVCPAYRLAPEHPFPAALDDVTAVAKALFAENPNTLLAGESAGGNLALALAQRLLGQGAPLPPAIATLSPATDLGGHGDSAEADRDPFLKLERTSDVHEAYIPGEDTTNPEISPIFGTYDSDFPPTLITTGTRDLLLSGCVRLARVMREAGAPVDLRVWEGMWHVFEFYPDIPEAKASLAEISAFLNQHF